MADRLHSPAHFPAHLPSVAIPEIDRCIQKGIVEKTYSAAACIASVGGKVFHRAVYGSPVHPPPLRKVDFDLLFDLASLTKPLATGLAVMHLAGKGRIDLGATLDKTLPEFHKQPHLHNVTLDMLLDHTSGWQASAPRVYEALRQSDAHRPPKQRVLGTRAAVAHYKQAIAALPLEHPPGSTSVYSDVNFIALGWIIESLVNQPLDTFLEHDIYRPLGLQDQLLFIRLDDAKARAPLRKRVFAATEQCAWRDKLLQGEVHDPAAWAMGGVAGHAGLFGSADAVWKLCTSLLAAYHGRPAFFHNATVQRFWTRSKRVRDTTRALAWDTPSAIRPSAGLRFSRSSVGHLGFTGCALWIDPTKDIIGVVLTNAVHPTAEGKKERMAQFRPRVFDLIAKYGELHA